MLKHTRYLGELNRYLALHWDVPETEAARPPEALEKKGRLGGLFGRPRKAAAKQAAPQMPAESAMPPGFCQVCDDEIPVEAASPYLQRLKDALAARRDESFSQMLTRLIDASGLTDAQCYNRAQMNRALFNRIKNNPDYRVQKNSALALGLALRLDRDGLDSLLARAGYALTTNSKADVIVMFFLDRGIHDISLINEYLLQFDQPLLGSSVRE